MAVNLTFFGQRTLAVGVHSVNLTLPAGDTAIDATVSALATSTRQTPDGPEGVIAGVAACVLADSDDGVTYHPRCAQYVGAVAGSGTIHLDTARPRLRYTITVTVAPVTLSVSGSVS